MPPPEEGGRGVGNDRSPYTPREILTSRYALVPRLDENRMRAGRDEGMDSRAFNGILRYAQNEGMDSRAFYGILRYAQNERGGMSAGFRNPSVTA